MPVTDLSDGGDDWLQQFLAGHVAGQAFGASQGGGGYPTMGLRPPEAGGTPGQVSGRVGYGLPGQTMPTGAPSMGYPALGQPSAQPPPAASPGPAQGLSLTSSPITRALNFLSPISSAQAGELPAPPPTSGSPLPPTARDVLPLAYGLPTSDDYQKWLKFQNLSPASTTTAPPTSPSQPARPVTPTPSSAYPPPSQPARPVTPTPASAYPPAGQPSQTPRPSDSRNPFAMIDRVNAGPVAQPGRGYQTALDLSSLFGGRGQAPPAATNPANVPAPNAQPVSGALAQGGMSSAPWWMGPFQQGVFGPSAKDLAAAKKRSGYQ